MTDTIYILSGERDEEKEYIVRNKFDVFETMEFVYDSNESLTGLGSNVTDMINSGHAHINVVFSDYPVDLVHIVVNFLDEFMKHAVFNYYSFYGQELVTLVR